MFKRYLLTIVAIFLFVFIVSAGENEEKPVAQDGVIDISHWNFEKFGSLYLRGEWEMYWDTLLNPEDFIGEIPKATGYFNFPAYWNNQTINGKALNNFGYATIRLKVKSDKKLNLMVNLKEFMTNYRFYLNGDLLAVNGTPGTTREESVPQYYQQNIIVSLHKGLNEILIQSSNFHHRSGGYYDDIEIGEVQYMIHKRIGAIGFDLFLFGSLLIMALYHLGFFIFRTSNKSTLYFAIFTLWVALRVLLTSEQVISVFIPNLSFGLAYRLEYLTIWMAPTFFALFFYSLYPKEVPKWLVMIFVGTCALLSIFIFIVPTYIYSYTSTPYQIFMLFGVVVSLYSTILAIIRKREGALLLLVGILALFLSVINDVLYVQGIVKFMELSPVGLFIFTLCQSLVVSRVFTKTYNLNIKLTKELEYNNKNLEKIVNERTFEIHQQKEEIQSQADLLEQQNKRLEQLSIVASETENAVTIANAEGIIEWVNAGFQKLYGYNFEEFIDNRGANLLKASFNDAMLDAFMTCIESESSVVYTSEITTKKGETKWVRTTLTPIYNSEQNLHRLVTIDSDITDLKQAEEAIRQQNEEITSQSDQLQKQNEILEKKNITIINSISYAKLIQDAVLPTIEEIQSVLPDTFIIYYPRDIVSGDFYWYKKCQNKVFIAAIDCTGHGVPGAFMSMIGNTILNQVINEKHIEDPTEILEQLDAGVRYALSQEKEGDTQDDGMDVSLCVIDLEKKELNMSLANHVALYFDGNQLEYIQGDAFSIGGFFSKPKDKTFSSHKRKLNKDSILYMFTDGFQDQFGGENNEKLHLARLKQLIELHVSQSIKSQKESISTAFKDWKGNERQIDDVLLIGCKMTSICD